MDISEFIEQDLSTGPNGEFLSATYGDITEDVTQALCDDNVYAEVNREKQAALRAEARRVAQDAKAAGMDRARMTKVGLLKARIPEDVYCFWQRKLGVNCWSDPDLLEYLLKYFPDELGVKYAAGENGRKLHSRVKRAQKRASRARVGRLFDGAGRLIEPAASKPYLATRKSTGRN